MAGAVDAVRAFLARPAVQDLLARLWLWLTIGVVVVVGVHLLVAAAVGLYLAFYWAYVPVALHAWPLHFDFSGAEPGLQATLPSTAVRLVDGAGRPVFAHRQGYDFVVELVVPDTGHNQARGMFMVTLALTPDRLPRPSLDTYHPGSTQSIQPLDAFGHKLSRPAGLRHIPWLVRTARSLLLLGPALVGLYREEQTLTVRLLENVFNSSQLPFEWAQVSLSSRLLHVAEARLLVHAHMTGITYLMYHWFFSSFLMGTYVTAVVLLTVVVAVALLCRYCCGRAVPPLRVAPALDEGPPRPAKDEVDYRQLIADPDVEWDEAQRLFVFKDPDAPGIDVGVPALPVPPPAGPAGDVEPGAVAAEATPGTEPAPSAPEPSGLRRRAVPGEAAL